MDTVKGYKVFNPDWTCRGKQYACPGKFEEDVHLSMCESGMHFCKKVCNCFNYYSFNPANRVAEVVAYGQIIESGDKCATDKLEVVREMPWHEVLAMANTGDWNSGNGNSGNGNSGKRNNGNCNSGDCNRGDWNSGDWNSGSYLTGCFNTGVSTSTIDFFNRPSDWTYRDWLSSDARCILESMPHNHNEWRWFCDMSDAEKAEHPEAETTDGYLKRIVVGTEEVNRWWKELATKDKRTVMALPNFDSAIFEEITGIKIDEDDG